MFEDIERIGKDDKVLVCITNKHMLEQVVWYHSVYPEGKWEAAILTTFANREFACKMLEECEKTGLFIKCVLIEENLKEAPFIKKLSTMLHFIAGYIGRKQKEIAQKRIQRVMGHFNYQKAIIQSNHSFFSTAIIQIMPPGRVICLEDGMPDYLERKTFYNLTFEGIIGFLLAKMGYTNYFSRSGETYKLTIDSKCIKYSSFPEQMKYRNYFKIKRLCLNQKKSNILKNEYFDLIIFSSVFDTYRMRGSCYDLLHNWLLEEYMDKRILIKKHPRENYDFKWNDLNITIEEGIKSGEEVLDYIDCHKIILLYTSALLVKLCSENKKFEIICFDNILSDFYWKSLMSDAALMGLDTSEFIHLNYH